MKKLGTMILILGLIFVGMGDSFLPKPLSTLSKKTRSNLNQFLLDLTPDPDFKKPSQQREDQVKELEEQVKSNRDN